MDLNQLTDLHNRRDNIAVVAREAQRNLYPVLAWPEDKALLKLSDLPLIQGRAPNLPASWVRVVPTVTRTFTGDHCLREFIRVDRAYYRRFVHHSGLTVVQELEVTTQTSDLGHNKIIDGADDNDHLRAKMLAQATIRNLTWISNATDLE